MVRIEDAPEKRTQLKGYRNVEDAIEGIQVRGAVARTGAQFRGWRSAGTKQRSSDADKGVWRG